MAATVASAVMLLLLVCLQVLCLCTVVSECVSIEADNEAAFASALSRNPARDHEYLSSDVHPNYRSAQLQRRRRAVTDVTFKAPSVPETKTGLLFTVGSAVSDANQRSFSISKSSLDSDVITIDSNNGNVYLAEGKRLNYEDEAMRSVVVDIAATRLSDNTDVVLITATLPVTDVNDESPQFRNAPSPYLATVAATETAGINIFELYASDDDADSEILYGLVSVDPEVYESRFEVTTQSLADGNYGQIQKGYLRTRGSGRFPEDQELKVTVLARDIKGDSTQLTVVTVRVLVGVRPPQFYEDPYNGLMYENSPINQMVTTQDGKELTVQVKTFQKGRVRFKVNDELNQPSGVFGIDDSGHISNFKVLDFESVDRSQQPLQYRLFVHVFQELGTTTLSNNASLLITVQDMNDNKPEFETSQYLKTVPEDLPVGSFVLEVKANDRDSGVNAEIVYSMDSPVFYVETKKNGDYSYVGVIKVKRRLDYDRIPGHFYEVTVFASDKGTPPKSSSVNVRVSVLNVNDEAPEFTSTTSVISVDENAPVGTVITIVQAVDQDGDGLSYYFTPREREMDNFRIDPSAGLISLARSVREGADFYILNITAYDNGACCGNAKTLSNDSHIIVQVVDINTHKPTFDNCTDYNIAKVKEHSPVGEFVVQVKAVDADRGPNGHVRYEIISPMDNTFRIGQNDGIITVGKDIDRETRSEKYIQVTVNGIDGATPPLDGWCTFRIEVEDINDKRPTFDRPLYTADITSDTQLNQVIIAIRAYDADIGQNGEIEYSLVNDAGIFGILPATGFIFLKSGLIGETSYQLLAMAKDKGTPPLNSTVSVIISVAKGTSSPPSWDKEYDQLVFDVEETAAVGTHIATMKCNSNILDQRVEFQIIREDGSSSPSTGTFSIIFNGNTMKLMVDGKLDYESVNSFTIRLRCLNFGPVTLQSEVNPTIRLIDKNDELPYFQGTSRQGRYPGSVPENMDPGQEVITITGYDNDVSTKFSQLTFALENPSDAFEIVQQANTRNTAVIRTKRRFDREEKSYYDLAVIAKDGADSDRPGHMPLNTPNSARVTVEVFIKDQNDNAPFFKQSLYEVDVAEDQYFDTAFTFITAEDPDETDKGRLDYLIISGNAPLYKFGVKGATGGLFVSKTLDYESGDRFFNLTLNATDGIHTASTHVLVTVLDANDNAPEFIDTPYRLENKVVEQDNSVLTNPKLLFRVTAADRDVDRPNQIQYSLQGYGTEPPNQFFQIDPTSGDIFVIRPLDRDAPHGRANYQFTVVAKDEPRQPWQYGYATVEVLPADINDNRPTFDTSRLQGSVLEHSPPGTSVMYVLATDPDFGNNGSVVYDIIKNSITVGSLRDYFIIDRSSGLIKTNVPPDELDRETIPFFSLEVRASDEGNPPLNTTATITIALSDINDQRPIFDPVVYRTEMSENQKSGEVFRVGATDADIGNNAKLTYSLAQSDRRFFQVVTVDNMGSILVYMAVDYEQATQQFFNLTVIAQDPDLTHTATAHIEIIVRDFNDNAPSVSPQVFTVDVMENMKPGSVLAIFDAIDKDSGENAKFEFSIDRASDPLRHFSIGATSGNVTLRRPLDRETKERHIVYIKAIDKGDPPMTGTGTLTVIVVDINDNFPQFRENYQPHVLEGDAVFPSKVQVVLGTDPDAFPFGPPFGFGATPCTNGLDICPCDGQPTCEHFSMTFEPSGDGGNGTATISTKGIFDREKQKYYHIPIVMWDMRGKDGKESKTGTNTLTVTIGDINDNKPRPGHQDIFVYNYKGKFGPLEIGRVYVEDEDDWDLPDKTFTFAEPLWLQDYFLVNKSTGMVTMTKGVPGNSPDRPKYEFKVDVYDSHWQIQVRSTVSVVVKELSEEAVANSGAIRVMGTTAEQFIIKHGSKKSKKEIFHELLAKQLGTPAIFVDIITVLDVGKYTDIRYAAHGSPYYQSSQTDSIVLLHKEEFERVVGIKILMVPIDACGEEQFEGGCYNFLNITERPAMVNANGTSFVGVEAVVTAREGCRALAFPDPNICTGDYCYHGGTCIKDSWGVLSCLCHAEFDGPRCQQRRHSFDGNSFALYPTLEQCEKSQTSIEFITKKDDGLLLYNGPLGKIDPLMEPEDYISLEIFGGYPRLLIDHGTGPLILSLDGQDENGAVIMQKLSDGQWHHIDIIRSGKNVEMVVDNCRSVKPMQDVQADTRPCSITGRTPGENSFLNVNTLLLLGGRFSKMSFPAEIVASNFDGCVRNLVHNGKLYDLHYKSTADFNSGQNGCPREDKVCGQGVFGKCGVNGTCIARLDLGEYKCICNPGWRGQKCQTPTTQRDLKQDSYLKWTLNLKFFSTNVVPEETEIQMRFRTRDKNGVLFTASSTDNTQTITLEINEGRVRVLYNLGDGEQQLELSGVAANNGQWHTVNVKRILQQMTLTLDGGEGRNYNYSRGSRNGKVNLVIQRLIFVGASVSYSQDVRVLTRDLSNTCIDDIRLNNGWFPMDLSENSNLDAVAELKENPNVEEGCHRRDCNPDSCPAGRGCFELWEHYECRCNPGTHEVDEICVSDCIPNPCSHNATCRIFEGHVACTCPPSWTGQFCEVPVPEGSVLSSMTTPGIIAIIISIFVVSLLLLLVFLLLKFRKRDSDSDKYILEVDPEDDIRENVINYDEEGAGEEDQDAYDISRLQKSEMDPMKASLDAPQLRERLRRNAPGEKPDVGDFISERMNDADGDPSAPPHDAVMEFCFEGDGSDAGSLSSLNTSTSGNSQDYDYLNEWGPKFSRLANMYGASEEMDEEGVQ